MDKAEHAWRVHELQLRAANTAHERYYRDATSLFSSVLGFADAALKASLVLNGGAAVATLAFVGAALTTDRIAGSGYIPLLNVLTVFGAGVLFSSVATGASYFAQLNYNAAHNEQNLTWEHPYVERTTASKNSEKWGDWFRILAITLVVSSYAAFVIGGLQFREFAKNAFLERPAVSTEATLGGQTQTQEVERQMESSSAYLVVALTSIAATIIGPIAAVAITVRWEGVRRAREAKQLIMQTLLATRGRYADPGYSWAMRTAPLQFAKNREVMGAHSAYMNAVRQKPAAEQAEQHDRECSRREGILISEMLRDLGYRGLTSEQIESYTAQGLADRERLMEQALRAVAVIAVQSERSAAAAERMANHVVGNLERT